MPLNSSDINLIKVDRDNARLIFQITNKKNVEEFLSNKALQEFLTAPFDTDLNIRGGRLTIEVDAEGKLIIGRQVTRDTFKPIACYDLALSFISFIMPQNDDNSIQLNDVVGGLIQKRPDEISDTAAKIMDVWTRAQPFSILPAPAVAPTAARTSVRIV